MGVGLVWCVRLALVFVLIGSMSLVAALLLLVCDIGSGLRRMLGAVAIGSFASLVLLVSAIACRQAGPSILAAAS